MAEKRKTDPLVVAQQIDAILEVDSIGKLVEAYFEWPCFAGIDFDRLGQSDPNCFEPSDLLALNLLDIRMGPAAIRRVLSGAFDQLLGKVDDDVDLWDSKMSQGTELRQSVQTLYSEIEKLPDVGRTTASKLLARKRPRLVPIRDGVVERQLRIAGDEFWSPLAAALSDDSAVSARRRIRVEGLAPSVDVSTLRRLDVAVWMIGSNSRNAKRARAEIGIE